MDSQQLQQHIECWTFAQHQKMFYRKLEEGQEGVKSITSREDVTEYRSNIWSSPLQHTSTSWTDTEKQRFEIIPVMADITINDGDLAQTIQKLKNWTAQGVDGVHNYCWKAFLNTYTCLAELLEEAVYSQIPLYFTQV